MTTQKNYDSFKEFLLNYLDSFFKAEVNIYSDILEFDYNNKNDYQIKNKKTLRPKILIFNIGKEIINPKKILKIARRFFLHNYITIIQPCEYEITYVNEIYLNHLKCVIFIKNKLLRKTILELGMILSKHENYILGYPYNENDILARKNYYMNRFQLSYKINKSALTKNASIFTHILFEKIRSTLTFKKRPTLFHITHWKAGSQWISKILKQCSPSYIIRASNPNDFCNSIIKSGFIYPALYVTYEQFSSMDIPENSRIIVVFRDLRDTLISLYFSMKYSHVLEHKHIVEIRRKLYELKSIEAGLLYLMQNGLKASANIQESWLNSRDVKIYKYEDFWENDTKLLVPILSECIPISKARINRIIKSNRFEYITKDRTSDDEKLYSHLRHGLPGDWKNYFNDEIKSNFKHLYGDLLIKLGYEKNNLW